MYLQISVARDFQMLFFVLKMILEAGITLIFVFQSRRRVNNYEASRAELIS